MPARTYEGFVLGSPLAPGGGGGGGNNAVFVDAVNTSNNLVATLPTNASGDLLVAFCNEDSGSSVWRAPPTGWATELASTPTGAEGGNIAVYTKISNGAEGATATFVNDNPAQALTITIVSVRNVDGVAPITARQLTNVTTSQGSPITVAATGVTAAQGDAILFWATVDKDSTPAITWGSQTAGYTERIDVDATWVSSTLATQDGVNAGATGTLNATATGQAGGYAAYVIAVNAS